LACRTSASRSLLNPPDASIIGEKGWRARAVRLSTSAAV
jgi:hypothetical protein